MGDNPAVTLPPGYEDAVPVSVRLPPGYEDAKPAQENPMSALSKAQTIGPGPGWFARKVNEVKAGLAAAQEGGGLKEQPTTLGNVAAAVGMLGTEFSSLAAPEEFNAGIGAIEKGMPAAKLAKASGMFKQVASNVAEDSVNMTDRMKDAMDAIKEASGVGSGGGTIADKVMSRLSNAEESPLTWSEGRTLYHNLGELTASDRMASNKNMLRLLNEFRSSLGEALENTARDNGSLAQYRDAMSTWAEGSKQQEKLNTIIDWAKKAAISGSLTAAGGGTAAAGWDLYQRLFGKKPTGQ